MGGTGEVRTPTPLDATKKHLDANIPFYEAVDLETPTKPHSGLVMRWRPEEKSWRNRRDHSPTNVTLYL